MFKRDRSILEAGSVSLTDNKVEEDEAKAKVKQSGDAVTGVPFESLSLKQARRALATKRWHILKAVSETENGDEELEDEIDQEISFHVSGAAGESGSATASAGSSDAKMLAMTGYKHDTQKEFSTLL